MEEQQVTTPTFSFIVPLFNEQDGLELFYRRLTDVAAKLGESYEIVFVNDGSRDDTGAILRRIAAADSHVKAVEFSRNFGHQVAVTAGYDFASGKAVISLDGDAQHPPEMIPDLVAKWREGFEVVCTVRKDTRGINPIRRAIGRCVYRFIAWTSGADLTDQADFRLMDRKAVDALKSHREHARFVRGLVKHIGFRQTQVQYVAAQRLAGKSSYSLRQLAGMAGAGVFNFSTKPLRLAVVLGVVLLAAVAVYVPTALVLWAFGAGLSPWWHLSMALAGLFGVQFLLLGLLGEYIGRIFEEAKQRPLYIIREKIGFTPPAQPPAPPVRKSSSPVFKGTGGFSVWT